MSDINFKTTLYNIGKTTILRLPSSASKQLPSRGVAMVKGTINNVPFVTALEPDGKGSHWFEVNKNLRQATSVKAGDTVNVSLESTKDWTEPDIPTDLSKALAAHPKAYATWQSTTPLARREWIRWIRSTGRDETRQHRIEVACSKLTSGMRRPCCFNSNICTDPTVSKSGVLLEA